MPENQSQPNASGNTAAAGEPRIIPQPDAPAPDRPSDSEAAHGQDGGAVRDPGVSEAHVDQNFGSLDGRETKDLEGEAQTGERLADRGGHPDS